MAGVVQPTGVNASTSQGEMIKSSNQALWIYNTNGVGFADATNLVAVVEQGQFDYETVAASQTDQILGVTGGLGDFLHKLIITVGTAATAAVSIKDGNGSSIPILPNSPGGGIGVYVVEFNIVTVNATTPGWKVTTGAGSTVLGIGRFTA